MRELLIIQSSGNRNNLLDTIVRLWIVITFEKFNCQDNSRYNISRCKRMDACRRCEIFQLSKKEASRASHHLSLNFSSGLYKKFRSKIKLGTSEEEHDIAASHTIFAAS